jgi:TatA/E family protein of Tat protein translocase
MQVPVLLFFDISAGELIIILLVAFVVFGPSRIPEIARKIGRGLNEVRRASDEIKREITKETNKVEKSLSLDELDLNKKQPNQQKGMDKTDRIPEEKQKLGNKNNKGDQEGPGDPQKES